MSKQRSQYGFSVVEVGIVGAVVVVAGLIGWRVYDTYFGGTQNNNLTEKVATAPELVQADLSELATLSSITDSAVKESAGTTVVHVELEKTNSGTFYKVQLSNGTVVVFNAQTGAKVRTSLGKEVSSEKLPATYDAGIGFARALEIAKAEKPNSKVFKIELELEGGVVVYSVRFSDKARVDVNAQNGAIVRTKNSRVIIPETQSGTNNASHSVRQDDEHRDEQSHNSGSGSVDDNPSHDDLHEDKLSDSDDDDDSDDDSSDDSDDDSSNSGRREDDSR